MIQLMEDPRVLLEVMDGAGGWPGGTAYYSPAPAPSSGTRWSSTTWRSIFRIFRSSWRMAAGRCTWRRRFSSCDDTARSGSTSPGFRLPDCWSTFRACPRWPTAFSGERTGRARASRTCGRTSTSSSPCRSATRTERRFSRPMRWLCFLLLASPAAAQARAADPAPPAPKALRFDLAPIAATRDSFAFFFKGVERGYAVWHYEIRQLETTQEILYTAHSEFRPVEEERLRVVLNRLTGEPIATFHHIDLFSPASDTVMVEHDLEVKGGAIGGGGRVGARRGAGQRHRAKRARPPRGRRSSPHPPAPP